MSRLSPYLLRDARHSIFRDRIASLILGTAALLAGATLPRTAAAAVYCAHTSSQLRSALVSAEDNGVDDTIRLTRTDFDTQGSSFHAFVGADESLTIEGGWQDAFGPCAMLTNDASRTVLNGNGLSHVLDIEGSSGSGSISVRNLTVRGGFRPDPAPWGAGLHMIGTQFGDISIERVHFIDNVSSSIGAGLYVSGGGDVSVLNSAFFGNSSYLNAAAMHVYSAHTIHFTNNTVSGNLAGQPETSEAAAHFGTPNSGSIFLSNNIFYANTTSGQSDLHVGLTTTLITNDIESMAGTPSPLSIGNVSVDPNFIGGSNLRLQEDSPVIDFGNNSALGGVGTVDIAGYTRINGIIDLGAYESAPLMSDGFE
ncbi:MAG: hypothetical protein IPG63_00980 [Xanthomonadales bacterium]|nr:hypothetical protein [Xanthomonadales bacterium]